MQRHAADGIGAAAVSFVANNRMALFGEMHADLVFASCLELYFDKRPLRVPLQHLYMRHRQLSNLSVWSGVDAVRRVLRQVGLNGELVPAQAALDDGSVTAPRAVILELILKPFLTFHSLRENQQA